MSLEVWNKTKLLIAARVALTTESWRLASAMDSFNGAFARRNSVVSASVFVLPLFLLEGSLSFSRHLVHAASCMTTRSEQTRIFARAKGINPSIC